MKVLLINGSPKKEGCTYTALKEVADELERNGVETEIFHIGTAPVKGCMGCGYCAKTGNHQCVYNDDTLNEAILKAKDADGFVFGSPVHYASASGAITSFLVLCRLSNGTQAGCGSSQLQTRRRNCGT